MRDRRDAAYRASDEEDLDSETKQTAATAKRARATVPAARRVDPRWLEPCDAATAPNSTGTSPRQRGADLHGVRACDGGDWKRSYQNDGQTELWGKLEILCHEVCDRLAGFACGAGSGWSIAASRVTCMKDTDV